MHRKPCQVWSTLVQVMWLVMSQVVECPCETFDTLPDSLIAFNNNTCAEYIFQKYVIECKLTQVSIVHVLGYSYPAIAFALFFQLHRRPSGRMWAVLTLSTFLCLIWQWWAWISSISGRVGALSTPLGPREESDDRVSKFELEEALGSGWVSTLSIPLVYESRRAWGKAC